METREGLRDELVAMLRASRELTPGTDHWLAERFLDRLDNSTFGTNRRKAAAPRRSRNPRRALAALLVAGLALAIGTPLSLHETQSHAAIAQRSFVVAQPAACWWHAQTRVFDSLRAELRWQERADPQSYRILGTSSRPNGRVAAALFHRACE